MRIRRCRWSGWMRKKIRERLCLIRSYIYKTVSWTWTAVKREVWMDGEEWGEKEVCRQSEEWARRHQTLRKVKELSQTSWSSSSSSWPAPPPSSWPCPSPTSPCSCPPPSGQPPWLSWPVPWSFRLWPWSESNQRELYDMKKTILIKINVFTKSTSDHVWRNYCKI